MAAFEPITLSRDCDVIEIPSGVPQRLPAGASVKIMQNLGSSFTVNSDRGYMYRIDGKDADALGLTSVVAPRRSSKRNRSRWERKDGLGPVEDDFRS